MKRIKHKNGFWNNKENCMKEASKYKCRGQLIRYANGCYCAMIRNGWINEADKLYFENKIHYKGENEPINLIYVYEIKEFNTCYVGRTNNIKRRDYQHRCGYYSHGKKEYDNLFKFCYENNIKMPNPIILENNLIASESQIREEYWLNYYIKNEWKILNKGKVGLNKGSLGAKIKWTYEKCKAESVKYIDRIDFKKHNIVAYNVSKKNKWIDDFHPWYLCKHKPNGFWRSIDNCQLVCNLYKDKKDLKTNYPSAYEYMRKYKFLDKMIFNNKKEL